MGISTIHERKNLIRAIKFLKNSSCSPCGIIAVRMSDCNQMGEMRMKFKISDGNVKVKHILRQAYQTFRQKKCDLSQFCLIQVGGNLRAVLPNDLLIGSFINNHKVDEFEISRISEIIQSNNCPSVISSPIRILRPNVDNSLERIITSPIQTIYVQPTDDNDEVVQLLSSVSEQQMLQLQSQRHGNRAASNTASKQNNNQNTKKNKGQTMNNQNINSNASTNRDNQVNASSASNYLQNYITSNRLSNKKSFNQIQQSSLSSQQLVPTFNQFQIKKHSVNETAFNYQANSLQTQPPSAKTQGQPQSINQQQQVNSLSRGNSIKKMKTLNGNQSNKAGNIQHPQNHNQQSFSNNSRGKKVNAKGGKQLNMYSTINGNGAQYQKQNKVTKKTENVSIHQQNELLSDEFVKIINDGHDDSHRQDRTPVNQKLVSKEQLIKSGHSKKSASIKQNLAQTYQQQTYAFQEQNKINNLNEIFSDFLDEQQTSNISVNNPTTQKKLSAKVRAESQHSRQHALLEEDSLENNKLKSIIPQHLQSVGNVNDINSHQGYILTEQNEKADIQIQNNNNQRPIKHMQHKSMYTLNSNQVKTIKNCNNNSSSKQNQIMQHFGTFDNTTALCYEFQPNHTISEMPQNYDVQSLNENYNLTNIYLCNQQPSQANKGQTTASTISRLNTEIDYIEEKENINLKSKCDMLDTNSGLGRRGGTMQNLGKGYGRSDSNPAKHKVKLVVQQFFRTTDIATSVMICS